VRSSDDFPLILHSELFALLRFVRLGQTYLSRLYEYLISRFRFHDHETFIDK
jgi:hypothetical protein